MRMKLYALLLLCISVGALTHADDTGRFYCFKCCRSVSMQLRAEHLSADLISVCTAQALERGEQCDPRTLQYAFGEGGNCQLYEFCASSVCVSDGRGNTNAYSLRDGFKVTP